MRLSLPTDSNPDPPPMSAVVAPITVSQLVVIESRVPTWATATVIYRDEAGNVVAFGTASRGDEMFTVAAAGPSVARLLCASPR